MYHLTSKLVIYKNVNKYFVKDHFGNNSCRYCNCSNIVRSCKKDVNKI